MDKIVRVKVTEAQHRALRVLAADRELSIQGLMLSALERSDVTQTAMIAPGTYTLRRTKAVRA